MKEISDILDAWAVARSAGQRAALATLVHVDGSSYRRPGARMLVTEQGEITGAISGGCLEGDALRKSLLAIHQSSPRLVTYDTGDPADASIGAQLGCAGIIKVLFEPINSSGHDHALELLSLVQKNRTEKVLVTLFHPDDPKGNHPGTCLLLEPEQTHGKIEGMENLLADAEEALQEKKSLHLEYKSNTDRLQAFIEFLPPRLRLVIAGAGNDAVPVAAIASAMGWEVTVTDGRNTHAQTDRFGAGCQVLLTNTDSLLQEVKPDGYTAFLLMTHNFANDLAVLKALLPTDVPYIGVLGPAKKLRHMLDEIAASGIRLTPQQFRRIHGPAGLELGAESPEEIALSMVSGVLAAMRNCPGGQLKDKPDVIHNRSALKLQIRQW